METPLLKYEPSGAWLGEGKRRFHIPMGSALYEVFCPFMEVIFSLLFLGINPKKGACVQSQEVWEESLSGEELSLIPCSHLKSARQGSKTFLTTSKALLFFFNA